MAPSKAGLFSAVMTAFTIETYKALQPDPTSAVTCVLQTISAHLSNGTTGLSSRPACEIHGSNSAHCLERIEHFDELIDTFNAGGSTQSSYIVPERLVSTLARINEEPHKIAHLRCVQVSRGVDRAPMSPNSTPDATALKGRSMVR